MSSSRFLLFVPILPPPRQIYRSQSSRETSKRYKEKLTSLILEIARKRKERSVKEGEASGAVDEVELDSSLSSLCVLLTILEEGVHLLHLRGCCSAADTDRSGKTWL